MGAFFHRHLDVISFEQPKITWVGAGIKVLKRCTQKSSEVLSITTSRWEILARFTNLLKLLVVPSRVLKQQEFDGMFVEK